MALNLVFVVTFSKETYQKFPIADRVTNCPAHSKLSGNRCRSLKCPWMTLRVYYLEQFVTIWNNLRWRESTVRYHRGKYITWSQENETLSQGLENCSKNSSKILQILPKLFRDFAWISKYSSKILPPRVTHADF